MQVNYKLNEKGKIISWVATPFEPDEPFIEVENPDEEIFIGYSTIINGKLYTNMKEVTDGRRKEEIRIRRELECFPIINRGLLWYETLTKEQLDELRVWYQAWLDATETLIIPDKPEWLH